MNNDPVIQWLLEGDVSIQYQTFRDLLDTEQPSLRSRIANEGWGRSLLYKRLPNGHWGRSFYNPKWISSHYTLLDLKNLAIEPTIPEIRQTLDLILQHEKAGDGGVNPHTGMMLSDVCVNGMFLKPVFVSFS